MGQQITSDTPYMYAKEGILILDTESTILSINLRAQELLNSTLLCSGKRFPFEKFSCYSQDDDLPLPNTAHPILLALQSETPQEDVIFGIMDNNNTIGWLSLSSKWFYDADKPYIVISLLDVSKIVKQNKELVAKERQLQLLVSSLNDMVFEVNKEGLFINFWTNNDNQLFYTPHQFLGKTISKLFPAVISVPTMRLIAIALQTGVQQEMDFISPLESHLNNWYHLQVKPILKSEERVALVISDITEEVEKREKIMLSEKKFNKAFHYSGLGMSITSLNGYCLNANRKLCQMLGYSKEEMLRLSFQECTHPDDLAEDIAHRNKLLANEIESFTLEKRYLHKSGHYVWCEFTISLVRNHRHHPQFFIAQIQNISNAKQNIEVLKSQKAELEFIKIDLESKIRQLQEFNEIVAHNLQTPVCNIQMLIDELLQHPAQAVMDTYLNLLKESGDNLGHTLQELTDVLELNQDGNITFQNCSFKEVTDKIYLQHLAKIQAQSAIINMDFRATHIHYPLVYLQSIINNLISNALTFTQVGRRPEIQISTYQKDGRIILSVSDNGIGIDLKKFKAQLFMFKKIFHRGFDSRGIGLFITRYQVENLGGKIDVESTPGKGSTFIIQF